jgi:signal transduction histidine kinase
MMLIKTNSLVKNILISQSLVVLFFFIVASAAFWFEFSSVSSEIKETSLHGQYAQISKYIKIDERNITSINLPEKIRDLYYQNDGPFAFSILKPSGEVITSSLTNNNALNSLITGEEFFHYGGVNANGHKKYFGKSFNYTSKGQELIVQVAQDEGKHDIVIDTIVEEFFEEFGWSIPFFFISLISCSLFILKRDLKPLEQLSRDIEELGTKHLDKRLCENDLPSEIKPIVKSFNEALARLEDGYIQQKRFTADAAHELRTPLAVLLARLDNAENTELNALLKKDMSVMTRLTSQLLKSAQLESGKIRIEDKLDLCTIAKDVISLMAPLAIKQHKNITVDLPNEEVLIAGHQEALFNMTRNLIENALRHTPKNTSIEVLITHAPSISIRDHGKGVDAINRENVFKRFWRGDRTDNSGSGLGLSIVKEIVKLHGAEISVSNHQKGGAIFCITFKNVQSM